MADTTEAVVHILLLDDHALFREGVGRLLAAEPEFHVAAHCGTIDEALQVLRETPVDVVLLDFDLGEHDGREFIRVARAQGFTGRILVVTAGVDRTAVTDLLRAGVSGLFMKRDSAAALAKGIREVMAGRVWLDREQLLPALGSGAATRPDDRRKPFTAREQQVLSGVFDGLANKEIASRLGVSESSIKATLQQLFSKTGVRTRNQLVRIVLEQYRDQIS
jgi:two-component system nitrate/nitrite response regulator NarL